MAGYFITGTDTDVGKTFVTSILASFMKEKGIDVMPYKPIQSGAIWKDGQLVAPDVEVYKKALPHLSKEQACTYLLKQASSPHLAAQSEGILFDFYTIYNQIARLQAKHDLVLVEGVGGVQVPIQNKYCMVDLMKDLNLPVIIVGRAGLGTLNHTLLTIQSLQQRKIPIAGVILNRLHKEDDGEIERDNVEMIERLGAVPVLGIVNYFNHIDHAINEPDQFATIFNSLLQYKGKQQYDKRSDLRY